MVTSLLPRTTWCPGTQGHPGLQGGAEADRAWEAGEAEGAKATEAPLWVLHWLPGRCRPLLIPGGEGLGTGTGVSSSHAVLYQVGCLLEKPLVDGHMSSPGRGQERLDRDVGALSVQRAA